MKSSEVDSPQNSSGALQQNPTPDIFCGLQNIDIELSGNDRNFIFGWTYPLTSHHSKAH